MKKSRIIGTRFDLNIGNYIKINKSTKSGYLMKLSVLIPVYNEEATIIPILEAIKRNGNIECETIVIDDCSTDSSSNLLRENKHLYHKYIRLEKNSGKGAAIKEGLKSASGDYVIFQDADMEYDPAEYVKMLKPVELFQADVVMGSRFLAPDYTRVAYFWHKVGNRFITFLFNVINNTTFTDIYSCYLLFKRELLIPDRLETEGWEQQAEILSRIAKKAVNIYEVPITYHGRTYEDGKKIRAHHTIAVIFAILKYSLFLSKEKA